MKTIKEILSLKPLDKKITIRGWVKTKRASKNVVFIAINDGSTIKNLQLVLESSKIDDNIENLNTGTSVKAEGKIVESQGGSQDIELSCDNIEILGLCPVDEYPLQPKRHSMEFLRSISQ